ncbi:hypothetical protein ACX80M_17440 [Pseudarthrobacter sp. MDT1-22]
MKYSIGRDVIMIYRRYRPVLGLSTGRRGNCQQGRVRGQFYSNGENPIPCRRLF